LLDAKAALRDKPDVEQVSPHINSNRPDRIALGGIKTAVAPGPEPPRSRADRTILLLHVLHEGQGSVRAYAAVALDVHLAAFYNRSSGHPLNVAVSV
jgi:hypothetical protein